MARRSRLMEYASRAGVPGIPAGESKAKKGSVLGKLQKAKNATKENSKKGEEDNE